MKVLRSVGQAAKSDTEVIWNPLEYQQLAEFLLAERGFSLAAYKELSIARRIASRIKARRCSSLADYIRLIKNDGNELNNLYNVLTINVSSFFRNKEVFDYLADHILPDIVRQKSGTGDNCINIWCVGCATGEEPYSMVFLLERSLKIRLKQFRVALNAVDVDADAIRRARDGIYAADKVAGLDPRLVRTCFRWVGEAFQVRDLYRNMVSFSTRDILAFEPVTTIYDLILCRNMLIYFSAENHYKVYAYLSRYLATGGYLVLGKAEILFPDKNSSFANVSLKNRIYRKIQ